MANGQLRMLNAVIIFSSLSCGTAQAERRLSFCAPRRTRFFRPLENSFDQAHQYTKPNLPYKVLI